MWVVGERQDFRGRFATLVEHWDGRRWSAVALPVSAGTGAVLDAVAVRDGEVWAVGQTDDATRQGRPLVAHLQHGRWETTVLTGVGAAFSNLTGVAVADRNQRPRPAHRTPPRYLTLGVSVPKASGA